MSRLEWIGGAALLVGFAVLIITVNKLTSDRGETLTALVRKDCEQAVQTMTGEPESFPNAKITNETSQSRLRVTRYNMFDADKRFQCRVEYGQGRSYIAYLKIDGEDRTQDYRLKERN